METVNVGVDTLQRIIKDLESAVNVCYNVDYSDNVIEKSPNYATGYSRATMQGVIEDLNRYKGVR